MKWSQDLNWASSFAIKCYFQHNAQVLGVKGCGPESKGSRNPDKKGAIHSFNKHLVMSKNERLVLGTWRRLRPGLVSQGAQASRGVQPKGELTRLPGKRGRGSSLTEGSDKTSLRRGSELRRCAALACRTRSCHSRTLRKPVSGSPFPGDGVHLLPLAYKPL